MKIVLAKEISDSLSEYTNADSSICVQQVTLWFDVIATELDLTEVSKEKLNYITTPSIIIKLSQSNQRIHDLLLGVAGYPNLDKEEAEFQVKCRLSVLKSAWMHRAYGLTLQDAFTDGELFFNALIKM
ncbi:hypothetical protein BTA15_20310 [Vibrio parahaemolyticus]|uniref:hypothetical protein n=1 Tax=Vibrio parahaemolyticus TaxID=670 RepID=UPI000A369F84|nr:hypothetical protein [Vibrio parahaemolyticus]OUD49941.1 hypothetical protein BTA15_20310 [Vibrio parahaemolyticus]HCG6653533.1 hypothetical protein [Vibrio parahaemolyticus]